MSNTFNTKRFSAVIEKAIKNGHKVFFKTEAGSKLVVSWNDDVKTFMYDVLGSSAYLIKGKYKIEGTYPDLYPNIAEVLERYQETKGNMLIYGGDLVDQDIYYNEEEGRIFIGKYRVSEEEFLTQCIFAKKD